MQETHGEYKIELMCKYLKTILLTFQEFSHHVMNYDPMTDYVTKLKLKIVAMTNFVPIIEHKLGK